MNDYFVAIFKDYFHRAYRAYTFNMLDERCKAYRAELDALKDQAIRRYTEQVRSFMMRIEHFHSQIIAHFRLCLATRKTRVSSFHTKMSHRADRYVACYKDQL